MKINTMLLVIVSLALILIVGIRYFIGETRPDITKEPPMPMVTYNNKQISVKMGSRVWGGISDAFFDWETIKDSASSVPPEGEIRIEFNYKPKPTKLYVDQVERDPSQENNWTSFGFKEPPLKGNLFKAPAEKNIYMVALQAVWSTGESVEYFFAIEVT